MSIAKTNETQSFGQIQFRSPHHPTAVVVGATGGIGQVIARRLMEAGYSVCAIGRNKGKLDKTIEVLQYAQGAHAAFSPPAPDLLSFQLSLESRREITKVFNTIRCIWGKINLLVCAHGAEPNPTEFTDIDAAEYRRVMEVDLYGTWACCQEVIPTMIRQESHDSIVLLSSFHARGTYPRRAVYALAKSGVSALTRSLCVEYAKCDININCIAPGQVANQRSIDIARKIQEETGENPYNKWCERAPSGELVNPEDIATTVEYLANCPSINGQTLFIDGGATASLWYEKH